jgi:hypothetical protein
MQKYQAISKFLLKQNKIAVIVTFQEIENMLGFALPASAYSHRAWWANTQSHPQAKAWLDVGWKISHVDLEKKEMRLIHPIAFTLNKIVEDGREISLKALFDAENVLFVITGPGGEANALYSWHDIFKSLLKANPRIFGISIDSNHEIFSQMLSELGYSTINSGKVLNSKRSISNFK